MREGIYQTYPLLRRQYDSLDDLGAVINRSRLTIFRRLNGEFTQREKELIAKDLISRGVENDIKETIKKYFGG